MVGQIRMASILLFDTFVDVHMTTPSTSDPTVFSIKPLLEGASLPLHEVPEDMPHYLSHNFEDSKISVSTFCTACPFHLMVNEQMKIVQVGDTVVRMMGAPSNGLNFNSYFRMLTPFQGNATFSRVLANMNRLFCFETTGTGVAQSKAENKVSTQPLTIIIHLPSDYNAKHCNIIEKPILSHRGQRHSISQGRNQPF